MRALRAIQGAALRLPASTLTMAGCILLLLAFPHNRACAQSVEGLVRDAAYNESQAHAKPSYWEYRVEKQVASGKLTEEQVDTSDGPVYRTLAIDGKPLNAGQRAQEAERIRKLQSEPRLQRKALEHHRQDEKTLAELLVLLPKAFTFQVKSVNGEEETLAFHPNPQFHSDSYEVRVMQALEGELVINTREKRITHLSGKLAEQVEFGYGLLGRVNKGGVFEIGRIEAAPGEWKTNLIRIQISGRFTFFATISKQEYETRSGFTRVPDHITIPQAYALLASTP